MRGVKEAITWDIIPGVSPPWRSWSPLVAFHPLPVVLFFNTQSGQRNRHQKIYITLSKSTFWLRDDQSKSEAYRKSRESCEKGDYADANLKSCHRVLANLNPLVEGLKFKSIEQLAYGLVDFAPSVGMYAGFTGDLLILNCWQVLHPDT